MLWPIWGFKATATNTRDSTNTRDRQDAGQGGGLGGDAATVAGDDTAVPLAPAVGYNRKQAKSNAFFGPRKTPISGKLVIPPLKK